MGEQVSSRRRGVAGIAVAAVVLVVAGVVAFAGQDSQDRAREQAPRVAASTVTASASVARAYTLRPDRKPGDTCRYPYQVLETGQRLVWVEDDWPFMAPAGTGGVWLLAGPDTNTYMWFPNELTPHTVMGASAHNRAGAWLDMPADVRTWCGKDQPTHAPR